jgi:hypothetical protein
MTHRGCGAWCSYVQARHVHPNLRRDDDSDSDFDDDFDDAVAVVVAVVAEAAAAAAAAAAVLAVLALAPERTALEAAMLLLLIGLPPSPWSKGMLLLVQGIVRTRSGLLAVLFRRQPASSVTSFLTGRPSHKSAGQIFRHPGRALSQLIIQ